MKVLLVNGSPNKYGTTNRGLVEVQKTLTENGVESEIFWLGNKPLSGCIACRKCADLKECIFDDKVNEFNNLAKDADAFVFGTPVHYAGASGAITSFMDRVFYSNLLGKLDNYRLKPAAVIACARRGGTTATLDQMMKYLTISEMPVVSSSYWNMLHGANAQDAELDAEGLFTMQNIGTNMAYILKCLEAGKASGVEFPPRVKKPFTNFIR